MAHNIARIEGTDQAWYADKPGWHGLGLVTPGARTARQVQKVVPAFRQPIELVPVYAKVGGRFVPFEGRMATHRHGSTDLLGIVSDEYPPINDADALATLEAVVNAARRASFVTAGLLGRGERGFASIDLSRVINLRIKRDPSRHESHIFGTWSHDGTAALRVGAWHNRVECQNMLNMALGYAENHGLVARIVHAGDVTAQVHEAQRILGLIERVAAAHVERMNALVEVSVTPRWMREFVQVLVPAPDPGDGGKRAAKNREDERDLILGLYANSPTLAHVPNTAYRAYQAVTEYADHGRPLRIGADTPTIVAADRRFRSVTEGPAAELKENALVLIERKVATGSFEASRN